MKAISLIKFFTVVGLIVFTANFSFATETKEDCIARVYREGKSKCNSETDPQKKQACLANAQTEANDNPECANKESKSDQKESATECKALLKEYDDAAKKMAEECARLNVEDNAKCRSIANKCRKGTDVFGSEEKDSGSAADSFANLMGAIAQMQGGAGQTTVDPECIIENDEKAAKEEERIDDKITKLREEIAKLKEDAVEADNKLNEKKADIDKEMLDIEKDFDKEKFTRQTKSQEDAGRMQKAILASEKKRKDNTAKIAEIQIKIGKVTFDQQKIMLDLSDAGVQKVCKDKRDEALKAKTAGTIDPKTGRTIKPTFSQKESQQIKKDIKLLETQCLQAAALEKKARIQEVIDRKRQFQADIERLETANADEAKAIEQEMKQMQDLKKISDEEDAKALDAKMKKLNSLNKSVVDFEEMTRKKKLSYGEKAKAKEDQINKLILDKQNVKAKFAKVSSVTKSEGASASNFIEKCCTNSDQSKNDKSCGRIIKAEADIKVSGAKPFKKAAPSTGK